jgi:Domain of unknown function (DUF4123)
MSPTCGSRFALVDGALFAGSRGYRLVQRAGLEPLFDPMGPDAELADAGAWLVDVHRAGTPELIELEALERVAPAVCWVSTEAGAAALLAHLRGHLDAALPDGRTALLRFHDPRVLAALAEVLHAEQWAELCGPVLRWEVWLGGQRVSLRGNDAAPQ